MLVEFVGQRFYLCLSDGRFMFAAQADIECLPYEKRAKGPGASRQREDAGAMDKDEPFTDESQRMENKT